MFRKVRLLLTVLLAYTLPVEAAPFKSPGKGAIAEIESWKALNENITISGVWGTTAAGLNNGARRRVRHVECVPVKADSVSCTYDVDRCLSEQAVDGWCNVSNRFTRSDEVIPAALASRGWKLIDP